MKQANTSPRGGRGWEHFIPNPKTKLLDQVREVMRFRHCDIRTVQEILGYESVETTQIYTHVMNRPGLG